MEDDSITGKITCKLDDDIEYEPVAEELDENNDSPKNHGQVEESAAEQAGSDEPLEITADIMSVEEVLPLGEPCRIVCFLDDGYCIGAQDGEEDLEKVILTASNENAMYEYYFWEYSENTYMLIHNETGLAISLQDGSMANNTRLCLMARTGDESQLWQIAPAPTEGYYYIISMSSGRYLDVTGLSVNEGNWLQVYQPGISDAQSWRFEVSY